MNTVTYMKFWRHSISSNLGQTGGKPGPKISSDEAEKCHYSGEPYSVYLKTKENSIVIIQVISELFIIDFLDENYIPTLKYTYVRNGKQELFLNTGRAYKYFEKREIYSCHCHFDHSGEVRIIWVTTYADDECLEQSATFDFDVEKHSLIEPKFGEFESLLDFGKRGLGESINFKGGSNTVWIF